MALNSFTTSPANSRQSEPLIGLSHEMSRMFDTFFSGANSLINLSAPGALVSPVKLDVVEDKQEVCLTAEMPGMRAQDIEVLLEGNTVYLKGHKQQFSDGQSDHVHLMERSYGEFLRVVPLPFMPDPATLTAEFECGVLTVHVPKRNGETAQQIRVHERSRDHVPQTSLEPSAGGQRTAPAREDSSSDAEEISGNDEDTSSSTQH